MWMQFETQAHPLAAQQDIPERTILPDRTRPDMGLLDIPMGISNSGPVVLGV